MRAFVTGSTGFIGGATVEHLLRGGWDVTALVRNPDRATRFAGKIALQPGDVTDPGSYREALKGFDAVLHLAAWYALGVTDRAGMERTNVYGTEQVLRAAGDAGVPRILYCSSVAALGTLPRGVVGDEQTVHAGRFASIYEESKFKAHAVSHALAAEGLPLVTVMPCAVYGPGDHSILGTLFGMYARRRLPLLPFFDSAVSWVHVEDVAAGVVGALTGGAPGEDYILGGDNETIGGLMRRIAPLTGIRVPRPVPDRLMRASLALGSVMARALGQAPGAIRDGYHTLDGSLMFSSAKAGRAFGYAFRGIEEGIPPMVEALKRA